MQLTGAPSGTAYTSYSVSLTWTAGDPSYDWSSDAIWALVNVPATSSATPVFYADPGSASNSADNGNTVTLNWNGYLDSPYTGGNPLHFWYTDYYADTSATWSNISITLDTNTAPPPPSTSFTLPSIGNTVALNNSIAASTVNWYSFVYTGGNLNIDTLGSTIAANSSLYFNNDTAIALYDALGGVVATNDDINFSAGNYLSSISVLQNQLTVGNTYYLAAGAYQTTFGSGFGASSTSPSTGNLRLNVTVVPEGNTAGLLGLGGFLGAGIAVVARRRKAA